MRLSDGQMRNSDHMALGKTQNSLCTKIKVAFCVYKNPEKLFSIDYSTIQPSENPILIDPCQLYPERGNTKPNGVKINWTVDKSISDFIYGLGSGIFRNLLTLFNNGFGEKILSSTKIIHFTGTDCTIQSSLRS